MPKHNIGTRLRAIGDSLHSGQTMTLVKDYDDYYICIVDDPSYKDAYVDNTIEGKVVQVDSKKVIEIEE